MPKTVSVTVATLKSHLAVSFLHTESLQAMTRATDLLLVQSTTSETATRTLLSQTLTHTTCMYIHTHTRRACRGEETDVYMCTCLFTWMGCILTCTCTCTRICIGGAIGRRAATSGQGAAGRGDGGAAGGGGGGGGAAPEAGGVGARGGGPPHPHAHARSTCT